MKLYDSLGNFVKTRKDIFDNKVAELTALNRQGLFTREQLNKQKTMAVRKYTGRVNRI